MFNSKLARYLVVALAVAFALVVLFVSIMPLNRVALGIRPAPGFGGSASGRVAYLHLGVHVITYGILAAVAWFTVSLAAPSATNRLVALGFVLLLGCSTEYLQHLLYNNPLEIDDVVSNVLSAAAFFGLLALWTRHYKSPPNVRTDEGEHVAYVLRDLGPHHGDD